VYYSTLLLPWIEDDAVLSATEPIMMMLSSIYCRKFSVLLGT
jgi:hypothetical protein